MKYILTVLFLTFCLQVTLFARTRTVDDNQLVTQLKVVENDSTFWYLYVYDAGKKVIETKSYRVDSTTWIRKSLTEWMYNGDNCISQRERVWKNNHWNFRYTIDYTYSNNTLQSETHSVYNNDIPVAVRKIDYICFQNLLSSRKEFANTLDGWHLITQTDYHYQMGSRADSVIISSFNADTLALRMVSTFKYSNDLLVSQHNRQYVNAGWVNSDSINWFYYPNSTQVQTQKNKTWNTGISAWENSQRIDYEYNDSSQLLSESYQHWATMFWTNDVRYDYVYDSNNVLLKKIQFMPIYDDWRSTVSINYSDIIVRNANTIQSTYEFWGGNKGDLTTSFIPFNFNGETVIRRAKSIQLSYAQFNDTILETSSQSTGSMDVYPNPTYGVFYINLHEKSLKSWVICDLNGRIMKQNESAIQTSVVDITDFPKGIYILKVLTDDSAGISKIIKR